MLSPHQSANGDESGKKMRLLDVSNGIEQVSERGGNQVDHGDEGCGVAVAPGPRSSRLEQTVHRFDAGVAVG